MLAKTGNLADAFVTAWKTLEIAQQVEPAITEAARATGKLEAEIDDGPAYWYLVHTFPGDDLRAMRWLARRRFGVFRPMQQRYGGGGEPAFPGWLFVFVWDIDKMMTRILTTPGVMSMICEPIRDSWIQEIREFSWQIQGKRLRSVARHSNPQKPKKPRRPYKFERKTLDRLKERLAAKGIEYNDAQWELINGLEPHLRIAVLERTLRPSTVLSSGSGA